MVDRSRIETSRLILRPFQLSDAEEYFRITRNYAIKKYVPGACQDTLEECRNDIDNVYSKGDFDHDFYYIIEEKKSHKIVGAIICVLIHNYDVSGFIDQYHRKMGYMFEALHAFVNNMPKGGALEFEIHVDNWASLSIVQSIPGIENISCEKHPIDAKHLYFRKVL